MDVQPLQLQALPNELLHNIFERLDLEDVLTMRQTCKIMSRVGVHFGSEVPLVPRRDKFRALSEIARHPLLASRMKSLFYVIDRLTPRDYDTWPYVRRRSYIHRLTILRRYSRSFQGLAVHAPCLLLTWWIRSFELLHKSPTQDSCINNDKL